MKTKELKLSDYDPSPARMRNADWEEAHPYRVPHRGRPAKGSAILPHGSFVLIEQLSGFLPLKQLVVRAFLHQEDWELSARALVSEHHEHQHEAWHSRVIQQQDVIQDFGCYSSYIARAENTQWHEAILRHQSEWHGSLDMIRLIEFLKKINPAMSKDAVKAAEAQLNGWYFQASEALRAATSRHTQYA